MLVRLMFLVLVLLGICGANLHAQDAVFTDWVPAKSKYGLTFTHTKSDAFVSIAEIKESGPEVVARAFKASRTSMPPKCGDMTKTITRSVSGGRMETFNVDQEWNCLIISMPSSTGVVAILAIDKQGSGANSKALAYALVAAATAGNTNNAQAALQPNASWPKGGQVPETRAEIDWQAAWKMGLNPDKDLLPTKFECFHLGANTPNPAADGILVVNADGRYRYNGVNISGEGTWQRSVEDTSIQYRFEGVLEHRKDDRGSTIIRSDKYGQWIILAEATDIGKYIACYQFGPSAEYARLQMASGLVDGETWQCKFQDGAIQPVQFSNGRYQSNSGGGVYRSYSINDGGDKWEGGLEFDGGPLENGQGKIEVTEYGQRSLAVGMTVNTRRGYWYSAEETTPVAQCFSNILGRNYPEYGTAAVPESGVTGGPSGEYSVWKYDAFSSGQANKIYSFASNGWYLDEAPENKAIDCNRTKPSGEPLCLRYELAAGKIRLQTYAGKWDEDEWEPLKKGPNAIDIGSSNYIKVQPLTGLKLDGAYKTQSSYSSGDIFNSLSTIIREGQYIFTTDGQFKAASGVFSRMGMGPGLYNNNAITGSSTSTSSDGSTGRYRIEGNWLILTRDDGVTACKFIHLGGVTTVPASNPEFIYIDDSLYSQE